MTTITASSRSKFASFLLGIFIALASFQAVPEDIEIFVTDEDSSVGKPNVLIVIDNSANWSRQSQQWPGGLTQGQSEVRAIKTVINGLADNSINVGLFEYSTDGNANTNEGGYVRSHIRPLTAQNKSIFSGHLDTIFNDINGPIEKRSQGNAFGTLFWDVYNYLGELTQSQTGAGTPASRADSAGYSTLYSNFRSPLTATDFCRRTIVIFIGNNAQGNLSSDSAAAVAALQAAGGDTTQIPFADFQVVQQAVTLPRGYSTACYSDAASCTADIDLADCAEQGFQSCACDATDSIACPQSQFTVIGTTSSSSTVSDNTVQSAGRVSTGEITLECKNSSQVPTYVCPSTSTLVENNSPQPNQTTTTTTSWSSCAYVSTGGAGCNGNKENYEPRGIRSVRTVISQSANSSATLGLTNSCSDSTASCDTTSFSACTDGTYDSCVCSVPSDTSGCPAGTTSQFQVTGSTTTSVATPTGTFSAAPGGVIADEWVKFLRQKGVPLPGSNGLSFSQVSTYTVDVFNAQQNADFSALLFNMARVGGGKYYQAKDEDDIVTALTQIFDEVQAVNSAFSSASLPVNATNRAQNENQVFIGLFKPDRTKDPRWFGNLKRYQLILDDSLAVRLGDSLGNEAVNNQTGFISDCAVSFWTTDSGDYWSQVISDDPAATSTCGTAANVNSDLPDGPFVEKGAAAQILRRSNNSAAVPDANGNYAVSRNMKTLVGGSLVDINGQLTTALGDYVEGADNGLNPQDEDLDTNLSETRASIHGDVIHSRPQPVNFGGSTGVVVYYGANDGAFRAVRADNGEEIWSFVAPEHLTKLARLQANTPLVNFSGGINGKDYFFDGASGVFQNLDNSKVYLYASQRRGGRKIYAFNVTSPESVPGHLWNLGCPSELSDVGCTTGFTEMGQTWSRPSPASVNGKPASEPAVIFGGGYDECEDENSASPSCSGSKGGGVYVVDGTNGTLERYFDFSAIDPSVRSVAADVVPLDVNGDGIADFAYAATTDGAIYRIDFTAAKADWRVTKVAAASGGRKFLFAPTLVNVGRQVYVAIGSGDREHPLESQYPFTDVINRFYVFLDDLNDIDPATVLNLDDTAVMDDRTTDPGCDQSTFILPGTSKRGWFINLTEQGAGEQVVTSASVAGGQVFFSTNRPTPASSLECTNSLGEARGYITSLFNGSGAVGVSGQCGGDRSSIFVGGGLPPSPVIATVPIVVDGETVIKTVLIGGAQKDGTVSSIVGAQQVKPTIASIRRPVSWRRDIDTD